MPSPLIGSMPNHPILLQYGQPEDNIFITPMVIGSPTPRTHTNSGQGPSSAEMFSPSSVDTMAHKCMFETIFKQDIPSYSI
jgi:hypothetical protein